MLRIRFARMTELKKRFFVEVSGKSMELASVVV